MAAPVPCRCRGPREPLPHLGDSMFEALMRPLIDAAQPLVQAFDTELAWPQRSLELTALGAQVLDGRQYWLDHAAATRWVGGGQLQPRQPHWTIDDAVQPRWRA